MFVQTEITPNPNSLKFVPGKKVSNDLPTEIIDKESKNKSNINLTDIEKKIVNILENKVRTAVAQDGGDIKFKNFKDGIVTVSLQGSCSGCPSSTMTLKQGVQNLLCHYIPEIKEVIAI